jgi:hypothetical protein
LIFNIISNIQIVFFIFFIIFVSILIHQQVYALKEYVDGEYNIKFEHPDEWKQDVKGNNEYRVDYDKNFVVRFIAKDVKPAFTGKVTLMVYTNIPDIKYFEKVLRTELLVIEPSERSIIAPTMHMENDIINIEKHNLPENEQPFVIIETSRYVAENSDNSPKPGSEMPVSYLIFVKNGIGYELSFSPPTVTMDNMIPIAKQIIDG